MVCWNPRSWRCGGSLVELPEVPCTESPGPAASPFAPSGLNLASQ